MLMQRISVAKGSITFSGEKETTAKSGKVATNLV
jgi:hypothetical protein